MTIDPVRDLKIMNEEVIADFSPLTKKVHDRLMRDPRPLTKLAEEADVPYQWIHSFARGWVAQPSAARIEALHVVLFGEPALEDDKVA